MIDLRIPSGAKVIELGGGANRHPAAQVNVDVRAGGSVDFVVNFEEENWPISSDEWDVVLGIFVAEHINWRKTNTFLREVFRILKPGGKAVLVTPNTKAQMEFLLRTQPWTDDPKAKEGCNPGQMLFGDLDYSENSHKSAWSPELAKQRLEAIGFIKVASGPYGAIQTDLVVEAYKPAKIEPALLDVHAASISRPEEPEPPPEPFPLKDIPREQLFDRHYFDGGTKYGGYAPPGYADFPQHVVTANYVLDRKPESVLSLGEGRGYVLKRIQDAGIRTQGIDISKHCQMTAVAKYILNRDLCLTPWGSDSNLYDLCFSNAFWEHISEEFIPAMVAEMERTCKRGLHGISFTRSDSDKTQATIRPKNWWVKRFPKTHEILSKEELESGTFPATVLNGDGKVKLNLGSFTTQSWYGWINIDQHDLSGFANANCFRFQRQDLRNGIPFATGSVDLIFMSHFFEHLSYTEGRAFLRECRRVIKPDGGMRILVPDAGHLTYQANADFMEGSKLLSEYDEINEGCANATTTMAKFWAMLHEGHAAAYDYETLAEVLQEAGFASYLADFRQTEVERNKQILKECLDCLPCLTLYVDAIPDIS